MISGFMLVAMVSLVLMSVSRATPSAAKSRLMQVREYISSNRLDDAERKLKEAETFLAGPGSDERAAVDVIWADIHALRAEVAAKRSPQPKAAPISAGPAVSTANFSAAKSRVMQAQMFLEGHRKNEAPDKLDEAEKYLQGATADEQAMVDAIKANIQSIRAQIGNAIPPAVQTPMPAAAPAVVAPMPTAAATPAAAVGTGNPSAAKSRVMTARMAMERGNVDECRTKLKEAESFLAGATEAEKAPIFVEMQSIRAGMAEQAKAAHAKKLKHAAGTLAKAQKLLADKMESYVEDKIKDAEADAAEVPEDMKGEFLADVKALRAKLGKPKTPEQRNLEDKIAGEIRMGEGNISSNPQRSREHFGRAAAKLAEEETRALLFPEIIAELQGKLTGARGKMLQAEKDDALSRAIAPLEELEALLKEDPYKGLDPMGAHRIFNDLDYKAKSVQAALDRVPVECRQDAEAKTIAAKLAVLREKAGAADAKWGKMKDLENLAGSWEWAKRSFEGWESETADSGGPGKVRAWLLYKSGMALRTIHGWLTNTRDAQELGEKYKDEPQVIEMLAEAKRTREAAGAKLNASFNQVMADAEALPLPEQTWDLSIPSRMAAEAEEWFENTSYKETNAARAKALDKKWKDEIARLEREYAAVYDKVKAESDARWPGIVAALKPQEGFNPADAASSIGKMMRMTDVRNRTGWDFDGYYGFAMWGADDTPIAGFYEQSILDAISDTYTKTRQGVNDHTDWDVILVIEGMGKINKRVTTTLIDERTRAVLGKVERHEAIPCVTVRVVALHAGAVAAGPL